jgi:F0F1-type ATP synthase delta subunit
MEELILSDFFTTKSQANNFSAHLNAISEKIYQLDFNLDKILQEHFGNRKMEKFISLLREKEVSIESKSALNQFFGKIQETILSLPTAILTFAIEPNEQILKSTSDWFLINLKKQVLIELKIDPNIIAGAVVSFQGKHLDCSIRSKFEEVCANTLKSTI